MYTIIMNDDKSLITSVKATLYQHEKLADKIQFLFPQTCGLVDLTKCIAKLKYIDQGNISRTEVLAKDSKLYKNKLRFVLPVDSKLNYFAGNIIVRIVFENDDENTTKTDQVMFTSDTIITISPSPTIEVDSTTDSTDFVDSKEFAILKSEIEELKKNQVNDLILTEDLLQLAINDEVIGDGVILPSVSVTDDEEGNPVVNFNNSPSYPTPDNSDDIEEDNVIEF